MREDLQMRQSYKMQGLTKSILLDHVDIVCILKGSEKVDDELVLQAGVQLDFPVDLQSAGLLFSRKQKERSASKVAQQSASRSSRTAAVGQQGVCWKDNRSKRIPGTNSSLTGVASCRA